MSRPVEWDKKIIEMIKAMYARFSYKEIADAVNKAFGTEHSPNAIRKVHERYYVDPKPEHTFAKPKVLLIDIETSPIIAAVWAVGGKPQHVPLENKIKDWAILSFSAKWFDKKPVMYMDTSKKADPYDDKELCLKLKELLDEADIVISQNGRKFDVPKINARLFEHKIPKPTSFRHIDTYLISRSHFAFTSNKLAYLTSKFTKHEKLKHSKFPGISLWLECCLNKNKKAFAEMKKYNVMDTVVLQEIYELLAPWDNSLNFTMYGDKETCSCGNSEFKASGYYYTNSCVYQKFQCTKCGKEYRDKKNLKTSRFANIK
jgi:DNA polymerase elongation subunit (family B)